MNDDAVRQLGAIAQHIDRAGETITRRVSVAVRKSAHDIAAAGQQLVHVDTGATRQSIHAAEPDGSPLGPLSLEADIGPTTHYAPHLEYGTSRMGPFPFMRPALDRHTPGFVDAVAEIAGEIL